MRTLDRFLRQIQLFSNLSQFMIKHVARLSHVVPVSPTVVAISG